MSATLLNNLKWAGDTDTYDMGLIVHTIAHGTSFLAAKILEEDHAQKVCESGAGFYIGANDEETGEPVARDSVEYWGTREEAQASLDNKSWTQRLHA
jgi:hypothetical protein